MKNIAIIGGGPAGLFAAITAAQNGARVSVFEKKERLARKLLITGKGRCNITNNIDIQDFIQNIPGNGVFLYSALYSFTNDNLIEFLNKIGVSTKVERGGRVFPASDKAMDVVDAIYKEAKRNDVQINCLSEVKRVMIEDGNVIGIQFENGESYPCDSVIVATGGMSYPLTGSTGAGYRMAKEVGHTIITLRPSLVPLNTKEKWVQQLMGISLRNVSIKFVDRDRKILYSDFGEMLFTHFGVSGPIIISGSRHLFDVPTPIMLYIDLKPALSVEKLDARVQRDFIKYANKQLKNGLIDLLPMKLIPIVIQLANIDMEKQVNQITKKERYELLSIIKNLPLTIEGFRPIEEAIVTAGGVSTDEINPSTMESKLINGLFFAGEVIDVDGYTGGFNLQIAFSTGYLAGLNATK